MNIYSVVSILLAISLGVMTYRSEKIISGLQLFQLEEYNIKAYKNWLNNNIKSISRSGPIIDDSKTPIVYTDRMNRLKKRLEHTIIGITGIEVILAILLRDSMLVTIPTIIAIVLYLYNPYIIILAAKLQEPVEEKINMGYYKDAQKKILEYKEDGLKVVGITGSYGKTSTKFIASTILKEKYDVQDTPSSYNTPMGLSLVINNQLTRDKEVFIAEMGAYVPGEIKEVADLVSPDIGVITSIGPMHLETFKTIDTIVETKSELLDALPKDGVAIINYDDPNLKSVADDRTEPTVKYGMENIDQLDIYATDIKTTRSGSEFKLWIRDEDRLSSVDCQTKMLGRHNILNILAGAAVGSVYGMSIEQISEGINKTEPVEHRLFLIPGAGGTTIIDDAFNSNPAGAKAALDVLSEFDDGRKIIVTPGMIGLGDIEEEANRTFGRQIAQVCDIVYLVGKNITKPVYRGLKDSGYSDDNIVVVDSLEEATAAFGPILRPGDVVLFENDLPDNYSEV